MSGLAGARCLVLGGGGFLGTNLCAALASAGVDVEVFGRRPAHRAPMPFRWHEADFADVGRMAQALMGKDYVVHLLGGRTPAQSNEQPTRDVEENLLPSLQLIDLCRALGVRRLLFASSGGTVYGVTGAEPVAEGHPTDPITAYGINKLTVERYLGLARRLHGFEAFVLRIANPYGPFQLAQRPQGIVGTMLARALSGGTVEIWGDGSVVRDFVHVDDVSAGVIAAMTYAGPEWIFNIGSGEGCSLAEVVETVARHTQLDRKRIRFLPGRAADVPVNILDVARLHRETGWRPQVEWDAGIAATAVWMRQAIDSRLIAPLGG